MKIPAMKSRLLLAAIIFVSSNAFTALHLKTLSFASKRPAIFYPKESALQSVLVDDTDQTTTISAATVTEQVTRPDKRPTTVKASTNLQRWRIRLDTQEDKFDSHKWTSAIFTLSSVGILVVGAQSGFREIPEALDVPTMIFAVSSVIQGFTALRMNAQFRRKDKLVKDGFDLMSYLMILNAWFAIFSSPFSPEIANNIWVSSPITILVSLPVLLGSLKQIVKLPENMEHRGVRKKEKGGDFGALGDILSYGGVVIIGTLLAIIPMFLLDASHDRQWLTEQNELMAAHGYYSTMASNLVAGFGALTITLRDKKLISKDQEQLFLAVLNIPFGVLLLTNVVDCIDANPIGF